MIKTKSFKKWQGVNKSWQELAQAYYNFTKKYKDELYNNFNIDCGIDYANYIFSIGNIKH